MYSINTVDRDLLGSDAVWTCRWVPTFRRNTMPQSSALKMEAVCSSETLVPTYKSTRRHNPENHNQQLHRRENLRIRAVSF
jgi:hypothetical protein